MSPSPHQKKSLFPNPFAPRKHTLHVTKAKEYHQMSTTELKETLKKLREGTMSIEVKTHQDTNKPLPHAAMHRENRKAIARIMTILIQRGERCV